MKRHEVKVGNVRIGAGRPLALMAGPCVIENRRDCLDLARRLQRLAAARRIPLIFKASYDKANRSSVSSYRGPGLQAGLEILAEVRETTGLPVMTDVHETREVAAAARVVDLLQIPAFLCRQTDLVLAAGETGLPVNVKKGQFLAPADMGQIVKKFESTGNRSLLLTERGTSFGYHTLVTDMRGLAVMRQWGYPVIFDATHSVQQPGGAGDRSSGDRTMAPVLARAAVAAGCDGVFLETYVNPETASSDRDNALRLRDVGPLYALLSAIDRVVRRVARPGGRRA